MPAMVTDQNAMMDAYTVVFDGLSHLGPGDRGLTLDIVARISPELPARPRVADLGCGVGASTMVLAQALPGARVLALDSHAPFIARLQNMAAAQGLGDRIDAVVGDMAAPPSLDGTRGEFDLIWSESAIYSLGRGQAFGRWRPLLRPNGWLVFSDVVWQNEPAQRSAQATAFWSEEYPDITTANTIVADLRMAGFRALEPVLSGRKVWSNYYEPLRQRLDQLAQLQQGSQALTDLMAELETEIGVYDQAGDDVALAFFLARRD